MEEQKIQADPEGMDIIPEYFARENDVLVINHNAETLTLAVPDPADYELIEAVQFLSGKRVRVVRADRNLIRQEIAKHYKKISDTPAKRVPTQFILKAILALLVEKGVVGRQELEEWLTARRERSSSSS